jgi:hypothetical protein
MGYRSHVAGAITGDKEIIAVLTARLKLTPLKIEQYWTDCIKYEEERITFEFEDIKWYGGYPEVDEFEAWYNEIEKMYDDSDNADDPMQSLCGKFIRIGEQSDDNTEQSFGDDWLDSPSLSRVIDWC